MGLKLNFTRELFIQDLQFEVRMNRTEVFVNLMKWVKFLYQQGWYREDKPRPFFGRRLFIMHKKTYRGGISYERDIKTVTRRGK